LLSWDYYVKRKRLDVSAFLKNNNIKNYGDFCRCLKSVGVTPPDKKSAPKFKAPIKPKPATLAVRAPAAKAIGKKPSKKVNKKTLKKPAVSIKPSNYILSVENDATDTTS
jgi:hypothetical protein